MKLYYAPGACSLAARISIHEAEIDATFERVDLKRKVTETGEDYLAINPAGSVPMVVFDKMNITENVAVLYLISQIEPRLALEGPLAKTRLLEMLSYLSTELHIAFKPFWHSADAAGRIAAAEAVGRRLDLIEARLAGPYLFGLNFSVADAYLFVMLRWAKAFGLDVPAGVQNLFDAVAERPAVLRALAEEA